MDKNLTYKPLEPNMQLAAPWMYTPAQANKSFYEFELERLDRENKEAYGQSIKNANAHNKDVRTARDLIKEAMASESEPTTEKMLNAARRAYSQQGLIEEAMALESQAALAESRMGGGFGGKNAVKTILGLAETMPEMAALLWKEQGLDQVYGDVDFNQFFRPDFKGSPKSGIWHVDRNGQLVIDKGPAGGSGRAPRYEIWSNGPAQKIRVNMNDPEEIDQALAMGFVRGDEDAINFGMRQGVMGQPGAEEPEVDQPGNVFSRWVQGLAATAASNKRGANAPNQPSNQPFGQKVYQLRQR